MLPNSNFTDPPVVAEFLTPNNEQYYHLKQTVLGGIALNDFSLGRGHQRWQVYYEQGIIHIKPESGAVVFTLEIAKVLTVSLAFDASMKIVLTWTTLTGAFLYYFDVDLNVYVTKSYPGVNSSRVAPDNIETFYAAQTDIIFAYTLNGNLYYRQQREKYNVEHLIAPTIYSLIKLGQSTEGRLQFQLVSPADMIGIGEVEDVPVTMTGPPPVIFTYTITPNKYSVNEGDSIVFTITTTYMPDGTIVKYANSSGNADEADFVNGCVGEVTVVNNTATFTLNLLNDLTTEDFQTLVMSIYTKSNVWLSSSHPILINDTSISLIAKFPVKLTTLAYTLIQPAVAKFPAKLISRGYTLIQPLTATFPVKFVVGGNSLIQSGTATFPVKVLVSNAALIQPTTAAFPVKITISTKTIIQPKTATFPVKAAVYSIIVTSDKLTMNEGENVTFNVTTTSINDGTVMGYYIGNGTANGSDFINDPYFNQVTLLLEAEGVNGSSSFVDSSLYNNQILAYGNAKISTLQSRSGASSLALDGDGDYVHVLSNMNMDSGDFTIDGWIYIQSLATSFTIFDSREAQNKNGFVFYVTANAAIRAVFMGGVSLSYTVTSGDSIMGSGWFHIALVKEGSAHRIYVNGNSVVTFNSTANYTLTNPTAKIGLVVENNLVHSANGYIDKLRVTKGVARYNSNFNPNALSGNFTVNNGAGSFKITAVNDMLTEGTETFVMNVANSQLTSRIGYSPIITVNDTSKTATYSITSSSTVMSENETVSFTVNTTNVSDNTILNYVISVGNVGSNDFSTPTGGQVTIIGNTASFNMTTREDLITEGTEIFVMSVYKAYGSWLASSPSVSITDSSKAPTFAPTSTPTSTPSSTTTSTTPTYSVVASTTNVNEGSRINFTVNTTNIVNGTQFYFQTYANSANLDIYDIAYGSATANGSGNNFIVNSNTSTFWVDILSDKVTEGVESFGVSIHSMKAWTDAGSIPGYQTPILAQTAIITVNDTSMTPTSTPLVVLAPTYNLSTNTTNINEGQSVIYTLTTTNVSSGTIVYFASDYGLVPHNNTVTGSDFGYPEYDSDSFAALFPMTINNNTATQTLTAANDLTTEGPETLAMTIRSTAGGALLARAPLVTVNDTSVSDPTVLMLGYNASWLNKTNWVSMVVSINDNPTNTGKSFIIRIIPTNPIFEVNHLEWAAFENTNYFDYFPIAATNNYIYQGTSSGPSVRLTTAGKGVTGGQIGTFRTELVSIQTNAILKTTDYSVNY